MIVKEQSIKGVSIRELMCVCAHTPIKERSLFPTALREAGYFTVAGDGIEIREMDA